MSESAGAECAALPGEDEVMFQKLLAEWDPYDTDGAWNPFDVGRDLIYKPSEPLAHNGESDASTFEKYDLLLREGARVAGLTRGLQFSLESNTIAPGGGAGADFAPGADNFAPQNARLLQEFFSGVAAHLLPSAARGPSFLRDCRRILMTANTHMAELWWFLNIKPVYVASFNNLSMENLVYARDEKGMRATERIDLQKGLHRCPIGLKLWHWLLDADADLIIQHLDEFLQCFIESYNEYGGPRLDFLELQQNFLLSIAYDFVKLAETMPQIYEWQAKSNWASVRNLSDLRPSPGGRTGDVQAWKQTIRLFNAAALIAHREVDKILRVRCAFGYVDRVLMRFADQHWLRVVEPIGAYLLAEPDDSSAVVSCFQHGTMICGDSKDCESEFISIRLPVQGWARARALEDKGAVQYNAGKTQGISCGDQTGDSMYFLFAHMAHVRSKFMADPLGMCGLASHILLEQIQDTAADFNTSIERLFNRGALRLVDGSFLARPVLQAGQSAEEEEMNWWPHSFLVFEGDGSIVDVTADQFNGGEPQIWWPADASRYSFSTSKASESGKKRMAAAGFHLEDKAPQSECLSRDL